MHSGEHTNFSPLTVRLLEMPPRVSCGTHTHHLNSIKDERWVSATLKAQSKLCATVAEDCRLKVRQCQQLNYTLLINLAQIIPQRDLDEISQELQSLYKGIVDGLHAQKILSRNSSKAKHVAKDQKKASTKKSVPPPPSVRSKSQGIGTQVCKPRDPPTRAGVKGQTSFHPTTGGTNQPKPGRTSTYSFRN